MSSQHEADELTHHSSHTCDMALGEAQWGPVYSFSTVTLTFVREKFQPKPPQTPMKQVQDSTSRRRCPGISLQIFIVSEAGLGTWTQAETKWRERSKYTEEEDPMGLRGEERATSAIETMARKPGPWPPAPHFHSSRACQGAGGWRVTGCCSISSLLSWIHYLVNDLGPLIRLTVLQSADNTCDNGGTLGVVPSFLPMCSNNNNTKLLNIAHISLLWEGCAASVKKGKTLAKAPAGRS